MSRSNPNENMKHPATRWIEYDGANGGFRYYDKEAINENGSKGKNVNMGAKIQFMFLDQTYTVTGWNDASHSGIMSNEIKDISNATLSVKPFKAQTPTVGTWGAIKDQVKSMGGKFTSNIYIAIKTNEGLSIAVLQLKGSAFAKWNDFKKNVGDKSVETGAVKVNSHLDGQKGAVKFKTPIFELISEITPESDAAAVELDKQLQEYFNSKIQEVVVPEPTQEDKPVQIDEPVKTNLNTRSDGDPFFAEEPAQSSSRGIDIDDDDDSIPF